MTDFDLPGGESTSAQLRRVTAERDELAQRLAELTDTFRSFDRSAFAIMKQRDTARAELAAVLNDREAVLAERNEARTAAEALRLQLDLARAEATSARYELAQVLERYSGWVVARDGGRDCDRCGQEIRRGEAYTNDTTGDVQTHVHCPDRGDTRG